MDSLGMHGHSLTGTPSTVMDIMRLHLSTEEHGAEYLHYMLDEYNDLRSPFPTSKNRR